MSKILELNSSVGSILVEIDENKTRYRGTADEVIEKIDMMFDSVIGEQIINQCKLFAKIFDKISGMENSPKKATTEFGLKINAQGNIYVVKTTAEANFKINFQWDI